VGSFDDGDDPLMNLMTWKPRTSNTRGRKQLSKFDDNDIPLMNLRAERGRRTLSNFDEELMNL